MTKRINKIYILLSGLLVISAIVGMVFIFFGDKFQLSLTPGINNKPGATTGTVVNPLPSPVTGEHPDDIQALKEKVMTLEMRVAELEMMLNSKSEIDETTPVYSNTSSVDAGLSLVNSNLKKDNLLKAGLSEAVAEDIIRRRSELELRKLELHDRATREGYLGTVRYVNEITALMSEDISLREELGDDAYDRYLYANNRTNRVKALSVIQGSEAEKAGMKDGDIIVSYGTLRVFEWNELKQETSKGTLGEYVTVDVLRNGQLMSLYLPRGPLGVRLGTARVEPGY